jgi:hypothetical protein
MSLQNFSIIESTLREGENQRLAAGLRTEAITRAVLEQLR